MRKKSEPREWKTNECWDVRGDEAHRWIVIAIITARLPDDVWASYQIEEGRGRLGAIVGVAAAQVVLAS
jgi:hypothetical protein